MENSARWQSPAGDFLADKIVTTKPIARGGLHGEDAVCLLGVGTPHALVITNLRAVTGTWTSTKPQWKAGFSLIELLAVMAVITILLAAGIKILSGTSAQARKTGTDALIATIEQGRSSAITTHSIVLLAIAEPGDLPAGDDRARLGLFKISEWPDSATTVNGTLLRRWQPIPTGAIPYGGDFEGIRNPFDLPEITVRYQSAGKDVEVTVHAIAFTPRGGLHWPTGSDPVVMRLAEGGYRGGKAVPDRRGDARIVSENRLRIGRVVARPWRIDG